MAHAYTPGLQVSPCVTLMRTRTLPLAGTVLVAPGTRVAAEETVARAELPGDVATLNVANVLGVAPAELPAFMLKQPGDAVAFNEPIAETHPWLAFLKTVVRAPAAGVVESVSAITGQVLIRGPAKPVELLAHIDGVVEEIIPGAGVRIRCTGAYAQGIFGVGREVSGALHIAPAGPGDPLTPAMVSETDRGAIVVAGGLVPGETWARAAQLGVRGLVAGSVEAADLAAILGYDLGVAVTGDEDLPVTLVITEGFGALAMAQRTYNLLCACAGRKASLSARTQIRAGVLRPEVIVPLDGDMSPVPQVNVSAESPGTSLVVGDVVRLIREPYLGMLGTVTELPGALEPIATGAVVRVLRVTLASGETITVPRANVEHAG